MVVQTTLLPYMVSRSVSMANLTRISLSLAGLSAVIGVFAAAPATMAQSANLSEQPVVDPNEGFSTPDNRGGLFGESSNPMDWIHRAVLMNDMSLTEFRQQHQNRMSEEAANFLQLQQQAIRERGTTGAAETPASIEDVDPAAE
jgi:hypothetical protein